MAAVLPTIHQPLLASQIPTRNRCCLLCEMTPSLLALVSSIVALAATLYFRSYYLCIPFGLGVLGSAYAVYTAYRARDIASLHHSSKALAQQVEALRSENTTLRHTSEDLKRSADTYSQENETLKQSNSNFKAQLSQLSTQLAQSQRQCELLTQQVRDLEAIRKKISEELTHAHQERDQHKSDLDQSREKLALLEASFQQTLSELRTTLNSLQQVSQLTETCQQNSTLSASLKDGLQKDLTECAMLIRKLSGQTLEEIFQAQQLINKQLQLQQQLLGQAQATHTSLNAEIPLLRKQREHLTAEISSLQETGQSLHNEVERLREHIDSLKQQMTTSTK
ncbi:MAG: hypothetical protein JSS62_01910 [Verrucomicrobia bacterium]|nr:hypothetical protein [Verrucomicrobiota bacterium]MBS0645539.1 hypothetical protein [Verrucomicrobiota bacterium]